VTDHPEIVATSSVIGASGPSVPTRFCHATSPFAAQTQVKMNGAYPLPWWGLQASAVLQNLPGIPIAANRTFLNTEIAPSLRRNLGACTGTVCNGTATIGLIEPYTLFERRLTQLDIRLTKIVRLGRLRVQGSFDVYNVFNGNTITSVNTTYGTDWLRPTSIEGARLFKFGGQLDF